MENPIKAGPSTGEHLGLSIPAYIEDNGVRYDFDRLAIHADGTLVLSQLAPDERVIEPGLIYRKV